MMENKISDFLSDVYSGGLNIWELVERERVFKDYDAREILLNSANLKLREPICFEELKTLITSCTDRDRDHRTTAGTVRDHFISLKKSCLYFKFEAVRIKENPKNPEEETSLLTKPIGITVELIDAYEPTSLGKNLDEFPPECRSQVEDLVGQLQHHIVLMLSVRDQQNHIFCQLTEKIQTQVKATSSKDAEIEMLKEQKKMVEGKNVLLKVEKEISKGAKRVGKELTRFGRRL